MIPNISQTPDLKEYNTEKVTGEKLNQIVQTTPSKSGEHGKSIEQQIDQLASQVQQAKIQEETKQSKVEHHYDRMMLHIETKVHKDIRDIWEALFNNVEGKGHLVRWKCHKNGRFCLTLKKTLKMWIPSTNEKEEEDPIGGLILMVGPVVRGTLSKNTFCFKDGFKCFCKYKIPFPFPSPFLGYMEVNPYISKLEYVNRNQIIFSAGAKILGKIFARGRNKTYDYLMSNWGKNGINLTNEDHQKFVRDKFDKSNSINQSV